MKIGEVKKQVSLGEDSRRQFKADLHNADSLAAEIAAFANGEGALFSSEWLMMARCRDYQIKM